MRKRCVAAQLGVWGYIWRKVKQSGSSIDDLIFVTNIPQIYLSQIFHKNICGIYLSQISHKLQIYLSQTSHKYICHKYPTNIFVKKNTNIFVEYICHKNPTKIFVENNTNIWLLNHLSSVFQVDWDEAAFKKLVESIT